LADNTESTSPAASRPFNWEIGRRRSITSSTRRSAASAKRAAWRIDADIAWRGLGRMLTRMPLRHMCIAPSQRCR